MIEDFLGDLVGGFVEIFFKFIPWYITLVLSIALIVLAVYLCNHMN